jgi:hypothetical protein
MIGPFGVPKPGHPSPAIPVNVVRRFSGHPWFPHKVTGVPHISLVFREIWDTTDVDR